MKAACLRALLPLRPRPPARLVAQLAALLAVLAVPGTAAAVEYSEPGKVISLAGLWLFSEGDSPSFKLASLDDLRWEERAVPTRNSQASEHWQGKAGWYRLHLELTKQTARSDLAISLGTVREAAEVYVNGSLVGTRGRFGQGRRGGARVVPLFSPVPAGVLREGSNVIAVRIYDPSFAGGMVGGALLLGPPDAVLAELALSTAPVIGIRVLLGLLALFVGILHLLLHLSRRASGGGWWGFAAGCSLAVANLAGTGLFGGFPGVDFLARLQGVALLVGTLCLGRFFADLYEDLGQGRVVIGQGVFLALVWIVVLIPDSWAYWVSAPLILLGALVITLYSANLAAQALRRGEPGTIVVFSGLCALAGLLVYDGFAAHTADVLPPMSAVGAVAVLTLTVGLQIRRLIVEHSTTLQRWVRLSQRIESVPYRSVIDAATLPLVDSENFLTTAIHEVARDLAVRRCSLVLEHSDHQLRIRASVGLPKHLDNRVMDADSISGFAFGNNQMLTVFNLPDELVRTKRNTHVTDAFLSIPVSHNGRVLGVLNLSDRNDGGDFATSDEAIAEEITEKLGLSISLLPSSAFDPPPPEEVAQPLTMQRPASVKARKTGDEGVRPQTVRMSENQAALATAPVDEIDETKAALAAAADALDVVGADDPWSLGDAEPDINHSDINDPFEEPAASTHEAATPGPEPATPPNREAAGEAALGGPAENDPADETIN